MNPALALIIANVVWGAASPIFKLALTNIPPFILAFIRFFFASFLLFPLALKRWKALDTKQLFAICLGGFFGITINISFFFLGLPKTLSINAPIIASSQPIFLYLISIFFLREKPHKNVLVGIVISFIGVLIIVLTPYLLDGSLTILQKETQVLGNIFLMIATAGSVFHVLTYKKILKHVDAMQVSYISFLFGALTFIPFALPELAQWSFTQLNMNGWLGILFGVFFSSALAYALFVYGIGKINAQEVGLYTYIDPVIAVVLAAPLLKEYPTPFFYVGTAFVFIGILIAEKRIHWHPFHKLRAK